MSTAGIERPAFRQARLTTDSRVDKLGEVSLGFLRLKVRCPFLRVDR